MSRIALLLTLLLPIACGPNAFPARSPPAHDESPSDGGPSDPPNPPDECPVAWRGDLQLGTALDDEATDLWLDPDGTLFVTGYEGGRVGLDNIDVEACKGRGIAVYPANGANDLSVAEYVITASLMLLRRAWLSTADMVAGAWPRQKLIGEELSGKVMGLVGYGAIARQVAERAVALGMTCIGYDPFLAADNPAWGSTQPRSLEQLLAQADIVSLHTPLTAETRHLIGAKALAGMKKGAILVNAARGGVVDEAALAEALKAGRIGGAALDVFEVEPLTAEAGARFAGLSNLLLTPHIAGVTEESNVRVSSLVARKVAEHLGASK